MPIEGYCCTHALHFPKQQWQLLPGAVFLMKESTGDFVIFALVTNIQIRYHRKEKDIPTTPQIPREQPAQPSRLPHPQPMFQPTLLGDLVHSLSASVTHSFPASPKLLFSFTHAFTPHPTSAVQECACHLPPISERSHARDISKEQF